MNTKELNKSLRSDARYLGLCDEWFGKWDDNRSNEELVAMMYKGIDFVLKHHWPTNGFIVKNFDRCFLRDNGVFVDDKRSANNIKESLILGNSEITLRYNGWSCGRVFVRDGSSLRISAKNHSYVIVHIFDGAKVSAVQSDNAEILVISHSKNAEIKTEGAQVKVKEELDYLNK